MAKTARNDTWAEEIVRRFGKAAKKARGKRSAQWLSDETARLGHRISPGVIAKLDAGWRGTVLNVHEVLLISVALHTSPISLLFGDGLPDGGYQLLPDESLPGATVSTIDAMGWFCGDIELVDYGSYLTDEDPTDEALALDTIVNLSRGLREAMSEQRKATTRAARAAAKGDADRAAEHTQAALVWQKVAERDRATIRRFGGTVSEDDDA